jgi:hypothetical protein
VNPDSGSAWWAELLMGTACCVAVVLFCLSLTEFGPFAVVRVVYPTVLTTVYLVAATAFGVELLRSGVSRSPYHRLSASGEDATTRDATPARGDSEA